MNQIIVEVISNDPDIRHTYQTDYSDNSDSNDKIQKAVKKHFNDAKLFAKPFGYTAVKNGESILSRNNLYKLQLKDSKNLITYRILFNTKKGDKITQQFVVIFNDKKFEYNNIKDAYRQFKSLIESNTSIETPQSSDGNIVTDKDSSNKYQLFNSQYKSLKDIAENNGFTIKQHIENELVIYFKNTDTNDTILYQFSSNMKDYKIIFTPYRQEQITKTFTKIYQAYKYVSELLTSKKTKGDKSVKEPLVKDVKDEIKNVDKFDKLFDTIISYKESNDKGYTRLINFLTGELYKNKDIKSIIDLDYNGDTSQIKNIINNHFTKK